MGRLCAACAGQNHLVQNATAELLQLPPERLLLLQKLPQLMLLADQTAAVFEAAEALARLRGGKHVNAALLAHVDDRRSCSTCTALRMVSGETLYSLDSFDLPESFSPSCNSPSAMRCAMDRANPHILRKCVVFHRKSLLFPSFLSYYIN